MAGQTHILDKTCKCTETNGVTRFYAVAPGTNAGEAKLPATAADPCEGIAQEAGVNGKNFRVRFQGISKAVAGAALATLRTPLVADTTGKLIAATLTATGSAVALQHLLAYNLTVASADGDEITVELAKGVIIRPAS